MPQKIFIKVLITLWAIWWARRKAIHENEFQSPLSTNLFINKYFADLELVQESSPQPKQGRLPVVKKWIPPPWGCMKINVDGAVAKSAQVGAVAAICRDKNGVFQGASAVVFSGLKDSTVLEAHACSEPMSLAADLNVQRVSLVSDCLPVINNLLGRRFGGLYGVILREVEEKAKGLRTAVFCHERRDDNWEADLIARAATYLPIGRHVWFIDPPDHMCIPRTIVS